MYERPAFVHRLFKFLCDDVLSPYLAAMQNDFGIADLIMDGRDAWASPPLITLDMMDEYVVAYTEKNRNSRRLFVSYYLLRLKAISCQQIVIFVVEMGLLLIPLVLLQKFVHDKKMGYFLHVNNSQLYDQRYRNAQ